MTKENRLCNLASILIIVFSLLFFRSCSISPNSNNSITIIVDSVYINQYEEEEPLGPIYIYYYLSIMNESNDTLNIFLPMSTVDEKTQGHNLFYGIYRNDTISFYSGTSTLVAPDDKVNFTIRFGSGIKITDLYEKGYNQEFDNIQSFIYDLVINSKLHFELMSSRYTLLPLH